MEFPLEEFTETNYLDNNKKKHLYAEDIYIFEFTFYDNPNASGTPLKGPLKKLIVATELMNGRSESKYDDVTFDQWLGNYEKCIKNKNFKVNSAVVDTVGAVADNKVKYSNNYKIWNSVNNSVPKAYSMFTDAEHDKTLVNDGFTVSAGISSKATIEYTSDVRLLSGPMWCNFLQFTDFNFDLLTNNDVGFFKPYTGKIDSNAFSHLIPVRAEKINKYLLQGISDFREIYNYDIHKIRINNANEYKSTTVEEVGANNKNKVYIS